MQARNILNEMKYISFQGLYDNELKEVLKAGANYVLTGCNLSIIKNMKLVVRHITELIDILDKAGGRFLMMHILDKYSIQIFQADDKVSYSLGYMAFGKCGKIDIVFRLCDKNQRGSFSCFEYKIQKNGYYVCDYEEDHATTRFSLSELQSQFDFKVCFTVNEKIDYIMSQVAIAYLFPLEFADSYEKFVSDVEKLLDYLEL